MSVFPAYEEELIENLLKAVWHFQEDSGKTSFPSSALPELAGNRATFQLMAQEELVRFGSDDMLSFTRQGERRAVEVIRRHRLAERLFYELFAIQKDLLDENACKIEHSLSAEVTEKLCIFTQASADLSARVADPGGCLLSQSGGSQVADRRKKKPAGYPGPG